MSTKKPIPDDSTRNGAHIEKQQRTEPRMGATVALRSTKVERNPGDEGKQENTSTSQVTQQPGTNYGILEYKRAINSLGLAFP